MDFTMKTMGKMENYGKTMDFTMKTMGKRWKTVGNIRRNYGKLIGKSKTPKEFTKENGEA